METSTTMKSSILDLIDFTTPNADWKDFSGFLNEINHELITNHMKIRQRIIPATNGNKIVTAGYATGCCACGDDRYEKWRRIALYVIDNQHPSDVKSDRCYTCEKKCEPFCEWLCGDCFEAVNSSKIYNMGIVSYNRNLTIVTTINHIMFCYGITHKCRIDILCKSVTASKWNDVNLNTDVPVHLDMVGVHNEHCFNKYSPCKCKKLSKQIFDMNLRKYTIFKYIDLLAEVTDTIGAIMKWFIR